MPSSYSASGRFTLQATGENLNTWGVILNSGVFQLIDTAVFGCLSFTLSGMKTLTTANGAADEARNAILKITSGTGGTVTIPSVSKEYTVINGAGGDVIVTTGGGSTATVKAGETVGVTCDGSNVRRIVPTDFGSARLTSVADPVNPQDAATKNYADALAFTANAGILPGQVGNAGKFLTTNGTTASWGAAWSPSNLHLSVTANVSSEVALLATSADVAMGGVKADTSGNVGFVNSAGADRLKIATTGQATLFSDAAASYPVATRTTDITAMAALDVDCSLATELFTKSISTNQTFTFSNPTASRFQGFVLKLTTSAGAVPTWPATVKWTGGVAPTLGNGVHLLAFLWDGNASLWYGVTLSVAAA